MALEEMLRTLEEEGKADCERCLSQGKERAKKVIEEAEQEAVAIKADHLAKAKAAVHSQGAGILNNARFFVKKEAIKTKEEILNGVFDEAMKRVGKLRGTDQYPNVFRQLVSEALANVGDKATVGCAQCDSEVARKILDELGVEYRLEPSLDCTGGVQVTTADGRVTFVNTFESRLEKAKQFLKPEIASLLFG